MSEIPYQQILVDVFKQIVARGGMGECGSLVVWEKGEFEVRNVKSIKNKNHVFVVLV